MDAREKLVELLTEFYGCDPMYYDVDALAIADHLVANGVTVPEWIPVDDRLPELGERVICTDGCAVFEQYRVEPSYVYGIWDRSGLKSPMQKVTHWMPLPQPPKGE